MLRRGNRYRGLVTGAGAATALALALSVAGCSSGTTGPAADGTTSSPSGSGTTSTSVVVPPYVAARNAFPDISRGPCRGNATAGWVLHGTVHNSAATSRRYSIAVDFITTSGDTVQGTRVVTVGPVAPHTSASWSTPATAQGKSGLTCVVRQALWS